jgi:hypothetical protein
LSSRPDARVRHLTGRLAAAVALVVALAGWPIRSEAQAPSTGGAFWPTVEAQGALVSRLRFSLSGGLKQGEDYEYQQWRAGAGLELQSEQFRKHRLIDVDPASEHKLNLGAGYQYLQTTEGPKPGSENRLYLGFTPRARPAGGLLLSDRNQFEFRWVNGAYSSRYRNRIGLEYASRIGSVRLTPYAQAEFLYDLTKDSWNEQRYTAGFQWPSHRILKLNTYFTRQVCPSCSPEFVNVAGLTLQYFFRNAR